MKCLVTKLQATVNDQNLPVLETMQQFTLDAITFSGNTAMTDDQKLALNHFFYQIGAIDDNTLWQKVKVLCMPMICGDNAAKALNDYVSNTVIAAAGTPTFVNHGLHYDSDPSTVVIGTDIFSGSSWDVSLLQATMKDSFVVGGVFKCMLDSGSSTDRLTFGGIDLGLQQTYYTGKVPGFTLNSPTVDELKYDVGCVTNGADSVSIKIGKPASNTYLGEKGTGSEISSRTAANIYSNGYLRLGMGKDLDLGLVMVTSALSDEESTKMLDAIKDLKFAFTTVSTPN